MPKYRIADLNFSYHNSWLIDLLKVRGDAFKKNNWEEVKRLNSVMSNKVRQNYNELTKPVSAFVTMESEVAYNCIC